MLHNLDAKTFEENLAQNPLPVLVYFWSSSCDECHHYFPVLEDMSLYFSDQITVVTINLESNPEIVSKYTIIGSPMIQVFVKGIQRYAFAGTISPFRLTRHLLEGKFITNKSTEPLDD
jgi:thioredoxin 1